MAVASNVNDLVREGRAETKMDREMSILDKVLKRFWWPAVTAAIGIAIALIWAAHSPRKYRVEVTLAPQSSQAGGGQLAGLANQLGSLSSLVGLNLGQDSNASIALATLKGRRFLADFIQDNNLMPKLFADRWDSANGRWKGDPPTLNRAVDMFDRGGLRKILEDRKNGVITMQIEWRNPTEAAAWLEALVRRVNTKLRQRAIEEGQRSLRYLDDELGKTSILEVHQAISRVTEAQLNQIMLANVREDYAFRVVDGPLIPDPRDNVWPRPALMSAVGLLIGGALGVAAAAIAPRRLRRH